MFIIQAAHWSLSVIVHGKTCRLIGHFREHEVLTELINMKMAGGKIHKTEVHYPKQILFDCYLTI